MKKTIQYFINDTWEIAKRNLIRYKRSPKLLFFATVQPIMFVLLFAYVFGGAIDVPGVSYISFLIPAIIVQTVLFGATNTAVGIAEDMDKGLIDRFRSLPMSRPAVLSGRTMADLFRNLFTVIIMLSVGYIIGFRIETTIVEAVGGVMLALSFGFAISWVMATIGIVAKDSETAQMAGMVIMFPLTFASSAFVPVQSMPSALRWFAEHSPITYSVDTLRGLLVTGIYSETIVPMIIWVVALAVIFFSIAVTKYKKIA